MRFIGTESPINALEAMGHRSGQAARRDLSPLPQDIENRAPFLRADVAGSEAQGFGDAHPGLKEGEDEELISKSVAPMASGGQTANLFPGQVGDCI